MKRAEMPRPSKPMMRFKPIRRISAKHRAELVVRGSLRGALYVRDGGCCVACGHALHHGVSEWCGHHRVRVSQGGPTSMVNLIAVHLVCHAERIHRSPVTAEANGWLLRRGVDPATVPVLYPDGRRVLLTERTAP